MPHLTCPIDSSLLAEAKTAKQNSSKCPECGGVWLTIESMESLEDRASNKEMIKGQRKYGSREVDHKCPHCDRSMIRFRYRGYNLEIEACPDELGFWLDKSEDKSIRSIMKKRSDNLHRANSAERSWNKLRNGGQNGLFQRVKDLFRIH